MYMLDTSMVQHLFNDNPRVAARYKSVQSVTFIGGIVVEEIIVRGFLVQIANIRSGASKADLERTFADLHNAIDTLAEFQKLPYTNGAEAIFKMLKSGKGSAKIKPMDGRIAAHALSLGMTVVTENVADFMVISGLAVENWVQ